MGRIEKTEVEIIKIKIKNGTSKEKNLENEKR